MNADEVFFDTSMLLYVLSEDVRKSERASALLEAGGVISVQVLNEFAHAARRKVKLSWGEVRESLSIVRDLCRVESLTEPIHERAVSVAEQYQFSFYDSLIVASALTAGCTTLYCEDLQHRQRIDRTLTIVNPFV